jgi:hypothetical protein
MKYHNKTKRVLSSYSRKVCRLDINIKLDPATPEQIQYLRSNGIDIPKNLTFIRAKALIKEHKNT